MDPEMISKNVFTIVSTEGMAQDSLYRIDSQALACT